MKRNLTILIALFLALPFIADAQVEQGKWFLSGSSDLTFNAGQWKYDFDGDESDGDKVTSFGLTPMIGYVVINRLPIGIFINGEMVTYKNPDNDDKVTTTFLAAGPFARYYFADLNNFMPFAEGSVGIGISQTKNNDDDPDKANYFVFRLGAGFSYFFNDFVGLDLFLGYARQTFTYKDSGPFEDETWKYNFGSFDSRLGIVVTLGGGSRQKSSSGQGRLDVRQ